MDFAGPVEGQMLLVIVDSTSKWPEIFPMATTTSVATINVLRSLFARFGFPEVIVTDNGRQFASTEFEEFMKKNGVQHVMGAPFHPQTNGMAERMVQSVKLALKKMEGQPGALKEKLLRFLLNYRNTTHNATGKSPAESLLGRRLRTRLDLVRPKEHPKRAVISPRFQDNQPVLIRDYRVGEKKWQEAVVDRRIGSYLYRVRVKDRFLKRHVDQMLPIQPDREAEPQSALDNTGPSECPGSTAVPEETLPRRSARIAEKQKGVLA